MSFCRICNNNLVTIHNFGNIALVGEFFKKKKKIKKYKISLNVCQKCKHVQIAEILKRDLLFKNYLWETGVSKSNIDLIKDLSNKLRKYGLNKKKKILEIASNDGSFLDYIKKKFHCLVLGVDPAKNLKKLTNKKKITTIVDYFSELLSKEIFSKYSSFDFIVARNVIAHVSDPNEIFRGAKTLLSKNGIMTLEFPHLLNIFKYNQYDNIFHEHLGYHTLKSIIDLCKENKLKVFNVELISSQGGSLRCFICRKESKINVSNKVKTILFKEKNAGLFSIKKLMAFRKKILFHIDEMKNLIKKIKNNKKKISIYGASGKGQALLQFCKLDDKLIDYAFDKSKLKQNYYISGTNIQIKNPKEIKKAKVDFLLLLSWNLKNEIIKQEQQFLKEGGKFIVPFPSPRIISL